MTHPNPQLSWIVSLYRNGSYAEDVVRRTAAAAELLDLKSEIIFVDDRCPEESGRQAESALISRPAVRGRVLFLPVNRGQDAAIREGLRICCGSHAMVVDGDLQDPPEMLAALWSTMQRTEVDVVFAARHGNYESADRLATSRIFRKTMEWVGGLPPQAGACALLNRRAIASVAATLGERPSFLAVLAAARLNSVSVPVERDARSDRRSAYGEWARLGRALHAIAQTVRGRWFRIPL